MLKACERDSLFWRLVPRLEVRFPVDVGFDVTPAIHDLPFIAVISGPEETATALTRLPLSVRGSMYRGLRI